MALKRTNWGSNKELAKDVLLLVLMNPFIWKGLNNNPGHSPFFFSFALEKVNFR